MQIIGQLIQTLIIFNLVKQSLRLEFFVVLCVTVIKYFTWMTAGNGVFGNVFDHHTPRLNNRTPSPIVTPPKTITRLPSYT